MTKKLEELFDLPESTMDSEEPDPIPAQELTISNETLTELDKIEQALPAVKGLDASDDEMDTLAKKATEGFDTLMDLGMQVDSRYASEIFAVAGTMLGHAITAKTAKLNKKLKMIDLQMKKVKLDREAGDDESVSGTTSTGTILDRNELLSKLIQRESPKKSE